jgi:ribosomal protein L25 (general stress protein Ctc)
MRKPLSTLAVLLAFAVPVFAHGKPEHGGQSVEVDNHSFELVVEPEAKATHLDLYINDPKEKTVATAMVKLQISGPDGQKMVLPLKYGNGHYTGVLTKVAKGEYKVVALSTIAGKKLNSRFSFKL